MKTLCLKITNLFRSIIDKNKKNRTTIVASGNTIVRPFSFNLLYAAIIIVISLFFWNMIVIEFFNRFSFDFFLTRLPNFFSIIEAMIRDIEWEYITQVFSPMIVTIQISIIGTVIGAALAFPVAFLASQNVIKSSKVTGIVKFILSILRTFPTLVYALILAFIFGYGTFVGVLATIIFTFSIVTKMMYEIIETVDMNSFIAIEASGASKIKAFRTAVIPQIMGNFFSVTLYNFEINIRSSAILGFVGAGGIGMLLNDLMSWREYGKVSIMLLVLLVVIIVIENLSRYIRKRLS
jgi:phosphonate transport system permease protein